MRRIISIMCAAALVMFAACQKEETAASKVALTATLEQQIDNGATKTALNPTNNVIWLAGDEIMVHTTNGLETLTLTDGQGTTIGSFGSTEGNDPDYAIYPASVNPSLTGSTFTFTLPATQTYAENSFGPGANVAVAAISGSNMSFKNVCGVLKLQLNGRMKVSKIELTGKNDEKLCGAFTVNAAANPFVGAVKEGEPTDDEKKVTLDCSHFGETSEDAADGGVQLDCETATIFDIIVPVSAFESGFEAKITGVLGETFCTTLETTADNTIARSTVTKMPVKAVSILPEGYTELRYLQSTGVQYIDTNVPFNGMNHTRAKYSLEDISKETGITKYVCGVRIGTNSAVGFDLYSTNYGLTFYPTKWTNTGKFVERSEVVETESIMKDSQQNFYVNGALITSASIASWTSMDGGLYTYSLFALNSFTRPGTSHWSGTSENIHEYLSCIKLYEYCMLNDDTFVNCFIPAKVKKTEGVTDARERNVPQGTVGLYDVVTREFYTNDGAGSFVAGTELAD